MIPNLGLPIPKSASVFHTPAYSQVGIATWKVADLLDDRQPMLQVVVLRKSQRCRIWTGCLISLVRTPGISFGFIACTYHSPYYLAELALLTNWWGRVGEWVGWGNLGWKVWRKHTVNEGSSLFNFQTVVYLSHWVTSTFPEKAPRSVLTKIHSFHQYILDTFYKLGPVLGVVTRIDAVPALRKLIAREGSTFMKE